MGFKLVLVTNNDEERGKKFGEALRVDYISRAEKPHTDPFIKLQELYGFDKEQMAHVGNSMLNDVAGGNSYGITTCLVRSVGKLIRTGEDLKEIINENVPPVEFEGHELREELKSRDIWRKHHKKEKGDQYYQLGEIQKYSRNFKPHECNNKN